MKIRLIIAASKVLHTAWSSSLWKHILKVSSIGKYLMAELTNPWVIDYSFIENEQEDKIQAKNEEQWWPDYFVGLDAEEVIVGLDELKGEEGHYAPEYGQADHHLAYNEGGLTFAEEMGELGPEGHVGGGVCWWGYC